MYDDIAIRILSSWGAVSNQLGEANVRGKWTDQVVGRELQVAGLHLTQIPNVPFLARPIRLSYFKQLMIIQKVLTFVFKDAISSQKKGGGCLL